MPAGNMHVRKDCTKIERGMHTTTHKVIDKVKQRYADSCGAKKKKGGGGGGGGKGTQ